MSKETFAVYADDLIRYQVDDVRQACREIGSHPRQSGEKAFPEVGVIISACERLAQLRRSDTARREKCGHCCDGMNVLTNDLGQPIGVVECRHCGGAQWMAASREHNRNLPVRGAA